jgi:hypothetical protein
MDGLRGKISGETQRTGPKRSTGTASDPRRSPCEFASRANFVIKTAKNKKMLFFLTFLRFFALEIKQNRNSTP